MLFFLFVIFFFFFFFFFFFQVIGTTNSLLLFSFIFTRLSQKLCNLLVQASLWHIYHVTKAVQAVLGNGMLWHTMYCFTLYDLKVAQMNVQFHLIQKIMFYKLELSHNTAEVTKNICFMKVIQWSDSSRNFTRCKNFSKLGSQ